MRDPTWHPDMASGAGGVVGVSRAVNDPRHPALCDERGDRSFPGDFHLLPDCGGLSGGK